MYRQGHYAKIRKPTGPELYEDASRILDELLQKQLNDQLLSHGRPPRYKTHPLSTRRPVTSGEVLDERDEDRLEDGIERSKTMPSVIRRTSREEPHLPKELEALKKKAEKHSHLKGDTSASSADTEGDSASVSENRKKKGFLRRAKDRLMHSFHRQEREKEKRLKDNDSPKVSPKKQPRKGTSKKSVSDQNGVKDKGSKDSKDSVASSQNEGYGKRRNSAGKALLNSLRRSFRSKKEDRRHPSLSIRDEADSEKRPSAGSSPGASKSSHDHDLLPSSLPSSLPSIPSSSSRPAAPSHESLGPPSGSSLTVPGVDRKGSAHSAHEKSASPFPPSSSTDSYLDNGDKSSSMYSFSSKQSRRNVLDDPGDDIQFMDVEENGDEKNEEDVQKFGGRRTIDSGGGVRNGEVVLDGRAQRQPYKQQSSLCVDGDSDTQDGKSHLPGNPDDLPLHERTTEEKEEMYGKIAQKLIHIADSYAAESGMSDAEGHQHHRGEGAAALPRLGPEGDGVLSELEKQILDCLRDLGDRNTGMIDPQAEEMVQKTKAEAYERFKTTVQQSVGNDISWNTLALIFYSTKGVVSAVGIGSKLANEAKEMTLRYFSDKFAKWLMDQGGFDSVLSESDSELD